MNPQVTHPQLKEKGTRKANNRTNERIILKAQTTKGNTKANHPQNPEEMDGTQRGQSKTDKHPGWTPKRRTTTPSTHPTEATPLNTAHARGREEDPAERENERRAQGGTSKMERTHREKKSRTERTATKDGRT